MAQLMHYNFASTKSAKLTIRKLEESISNLFGLIDVTYRKILRRMERIEDLPPHKQTLILKTIDTLPKGATA